MKLQLFVFCISRDLVWGAYNHSNISNGINKVQELELGRGRKMTYKHFSAQLYALKRQWSCKTN